MHEAILNLALWDRLDRSERALVAQDVARSLPTAFAFDTIELRELGGQSRDVAFFQHGGERFALVPGSPPAVLGYDRGRPFQPTAEQADNWARSIQREFGLSLAEALDEDLSPLRVVALPPMLVEVDARPHDFDQDPDGREEAYRQIAEGCSPEFRLPTVDEWEYVCAAGARMLFRWGDDFPLSCSHDECDWDLHRQPNAFGLVMSHDTYAVELCIGPQVRGGDGGCAVHGGIGKVSTWLPLASAFVVPDEELEDWCLDGVMVRRVRTVK